MNQLYVMIALTIVVVLGIGGGIWKWNDMSEQITTLKADKQTLLTTVDGQKQTIKSLNQDKEQTNKLIESRRLEQQELNKSINSLKQAISGLDSKEAVEWKRQTIPQDVLEKLK